MSRSRWARLAVYVALVSVAISSAVRAPAAERESVARLIAGLEQNNPARQKQAIDGLTEQGPAAKDAVPDLIKLAGNSDTELRGRAIRALGAIKVTNPDVLKVLSDRLADSVPLVRAYAAHALSELGAPAASTTPALVKLLNDPDAIVRRQVLKALRTIPHDQKQSIPALVAMLGKAPGEETAYILHTLTELGADAVPALIPLLKNAETRHWACLVFSELGEGATEAVPALVDLLADKDPAAAREAMLALGAMGAKAAPAVAAVQRRLADNDAMVRAAAAYVLGRIGAGANAAIPALHSRLQDSDDLVRAASTWALVKVEPNNSGLRKTARDLLLKQIGHERVNVRMAVVTALGQDFATDPGVSDALYQALADENQGVRAAAEMGLAQTGIAVLPLVEKALKDPERRIAVLNIVRNLGPQMKNALPGLIATLDQESPDVVCQALVGLASLQEESAPAVPKIAELLNRKTTVEVERHAVFTLGQIGPAAKAAKPAIVARLASKDPILPIAAAWALVRIDPATVDVVVALKALVPAIVQSENELVRTAALEAIGALGKRAASAAPEVTKLLDDPDQQVRDTAAAVLKSIGGNGNSK